MNENFQTCILVKRQESILDQDIIIDGDEISQKTDDSNIISLEMDSLHDSPLNSGMIERISSQMFYKVNQDCVQNIENVKLDDIFQSYEKNKDFEILLSSTESCLETNPRSVHEKDKNGATPLMHSPLPQVTELLIKYGANVNARDNHGCTPLMYAKCSKIVSLLIRNRADCNFRDNDGRTALLHAILRDSEIYSSSSCNQPFDIFSVAYDRSKLIRLIIRSVTRQHINLEDRKKSNAILYAVMVNDVETVRVLLQFGADVNSCDKYDQTPIIHAVNKKNIDMIRLLIDHRVIFGFIRITIFIEK